MTHTLLNVVLNKVVRLNIGDTMYKRELKFPRNVIRSKQRVNPVFAVSFTEDKNISKLFCDNLSCFVRPQGH